MTDEILDLADKMAKRVHENANFSFDKAREKGNKKVTYQEALITALILEIAALTYAVKQLQNK